MFLIDSHGGTPKRITFGRWNSRASGFSRDGRWTYFSSDRSGRFEIWKAPSDTTNADVNAVQVTHTGAVHAAESRDRKYLYIRKPGPPISPVTRVSINGEDERPVLPSVLFLNFAIAEEGIYFIPAPGADGYTLRFLSFASGRASDLAAIGDPQWMLNVSPGLRRDRRSVLYTQARQAASNLMLVENFQ
jgi:hypothetical protein